MINVLIVDDDPMVAELNKYYLSGQRFSLPGDGRHSERARALLADASVSIDLVLLDIYMQQENGLDLLPGLRELGEDRCDHHLFRQRCEHGAKGAALRRGGLPDQAVPVQPLQRGAEPLPAAVTASGAARVFASRRRQPAAPPARRRRAKAAEGPDQHHPEHGLRVDRTAARQRILHRQRPTPSAFRGCPAASTSSIWRRAAFSAPVFCTAPPAARSICIS